MEHDFILPAERETFIEQMKDVMDKAEDMLSEDTDADRNSDPGASPPHLGVGSLGSGEVSGECCSGTPVIAGESGQHPQFQVTHPLSTDPYLTPAGGSAVPGECTGVSAEWYVACSSGHNPGISISSPLGTL